MLSDRILQMLCGGCSDSTFKTADSEKPKVFILLGSIRDPLHFFFFKDVYPQRQQSTWGGQVVRNTLGGDSEGSREPAKISARAPQGFGCAFCPWCRKNVPRMASGPAPVTRPHKPSSLPPGRVGTEAGREACSGLLGVQGTTRAGGR